MSGKNLRRLLVTAVTALLLAQGALAEAALVPVGRAVGIEMDIDGLLVAGLCQVDTGTAEVCPAARAGIQAGDIIIKLGDADVRCADDWSAATEGLDGGCTSVTLLRDGGVIRYDVTPAMDSGGAWKLGLWLRDGIAGIGTVTFYDPATGLYGALGHCVADSATGSVLPLRKGGIVSATVSGAQRGEDGAAGQLTGSFDSGGAIGDIRLNTACGIFGLMDKAPAGDAVKAAADAEIRAGDALILANISGSETRLFKCRVTPEPAEGGLRLAVCVNDPELLSKTGGIVQGMSGSPILQDGRLIGAVTHVLLSDPSRGYGISIDTMLAAADSLSAAA